MNKIKVAINVIPLNSAHKERGIGYYTQNLLEALRKDENITVQPFIKISEVLDSDIIHYPWFDFFFRTLPVKRPAPTVVTIHDVIPLIFKNKYPPGIKGRINFFLQKLSLRGCKAVITDSEASKEDIIKNLKVEKLKVNVVSLAADGDFKILDETRLILTKRKYRLPDRFILYVGDANWVKNLPFLIKGFKQITDNSEFSDVKLIMVGGVFLKKIDDINHPELESLKKVNHLIKELKLEKNLIRVGNIGKEDLVGFYNLAAVYVQPSFYEGFGLPILQALSCGTPVVSSNGGSLKEVGGDAVIYFDPLNINAFVTVLKEVIQNKSLQDKLSRMGVKQAHRFSWANTASKTKLVYQKVLKND